MCFGLAETDVWNINIIIRFDEEAMYNKVWTNWWLFKYVGLYNLYKIEKKLIFVLFYGDIQIFSNLEQQQNFSNTWQSNTAKLWKDTYICCYNKQKYRIQIQLKENL